MNKKLLLRKAHRYIGLIVSLQLLAWTIGGIWFAWNDIDAIHGDHLRNDNSVDFSSKIAVNNLHALTVIEDFKALQSNEVISILEEPVYRIKYTAQDNSSKIALISAVDGLRININEQKATKIAQSKASFDAQIATSILLTETDNHHEYRQKPLPAWAITFDYPSSPTFYVSTKHGTVTSIRHTSWRIFDFLWMLHTMDYQGRDDFGNWLLKLFSIIALLTAISGIILFVISSRKSKKK